MLKLDAADINFEATSYLDCKSDGTEWTEDCELNACRLLGEIMICGTPMHVDAVLVEPITDHDKHTDWLIGYRAVDRDLQGVVDRMVALDSDELPRTTAIDGFIGEWLIVCHPYAE